MAGGSEGERSDADAFRLMAGGLSSRGAWRGVRNASEDTGETKISKTRAFPLFLWGTDPPSSRRSSEAALWGDCCFVSLKEHFPNRTVRAHTYILLSSLRKGTASSFHLCTYARPYLVELIRDINDIFRVLLI